MPNNCSGKAADNTTSVAVLLQPQCTDMGSCVVCHEQVSETTEPTPAERSRFTVNRHWIAFNTDTFQIYHEFASAADIVDMAEALDVNMSKWIFMSHSSGNTA